MHYNWALYKEVTPNGQLLYIYIATLYIYIYIATLYSFAELISKTRANDFDIIRNLQILHVSSMVNSWSL